MNSEEQEAEVKRTNVCFICSGPVPQVGPARTVVVAICEGCRPKYMTIFLGLIKNNCDWRVARVLTLMRFIPGGIP